MLLLLERSITTTIIITITFTITITINHLTTDDAFWCRQILAACYQLAQYVLKIYVLRLQKAWDRVGGSTALADSMAAVTTAFRKALVNAGLAICLLSSTNGRTTFIL